MDASIPEPSVERIEYARPEIYLTLNDSLGSEERIRAASAALLQKEPEQTLIAIGVWFQQNLKYDAQCAYVWRNFDTAVETGVFGGCADHAVVFTALVRACGIPTVFVKTMDADWIRDFCTGKPSSSWHGHIFLEVFVSGSWRLLDASALKIYEEYASAMRILSSDRFAYDKGCAPYLLVLSLDWERWKQQTAAYFSSFDLAQLPVSRGRDLISQQP